MKVKRILCLLVLAAAVFALPAPSHAQVSVGFSVSFGPPALPIYEQPLLPGAGYIWTPGYWAWNGYDYFWVPGTWVLAPEPGFLWTPGYWGWGGSAFVFYPGYWGPVVGFYGGINYGCGYFGRGYEGGRWDHGEFFYNRTVNNINVTVIHNVYNTTIVNNNNFNRVSYNGGQGGIEARATPQEEAAVHERHIPPVQAQVQHEQAARNNPQQFASTNHGKPPVAATPTPGAFNDRNVVHAKQAGAPYTPPANRGAANGGGNVPKSGMGNTGGNGMANEGGHNTPPVHVKDTTPVERPTLPSTGNPNKDQKYQQQQQKMAQKQDQERQQLQQKQEADHQRLAQQNANAAKQAQLEQKHQQQTQQLQQKHVEQQQQLQQKVQKAAPPPPPPSTSGKPHP